MLTYNGVALEVLTLNNVERSAVMDPTETDFLWERWVIDGTFVVNASATSLPRGASPAATDVAIRALLMQPRRQLTFAMNGITVLSSPLPGLTCDARNGPVVHRCDINRSVGENVTTICAFIVETNVNECGPAPGSTIPPLILSNRWSMRQSVDEDFMTTQQFVGDAIFRSDYLRSSRVSPDLFRKQLYIEVAAGYQRVGVETELLPNGAGVHYEITDRQLPLNLIPDMYFTDPAAMSFVTQCQVLHRQSLQSEDLFGSVFGGVERMLQNLANWKFARGEKAARAVNPLAGMMGKKGP